jgi:hypothetical protein
MSNECSEYVYPHLNIHNSSTRSHASEEENRSKNCKCRLALSVQKIVRLGLAVLGSSPEWYELLKRHLTFLI